MLSTDIPGQRADIVATPFTAVSICTRWLASMGACQVMAAVPRTLLRVVKLSSSPVGAENLIRAGSAGLPKSRAARWLGPRT
jgi:hypothetical protein